VTDTLTDFRRLFLSRTPLMDVRAPVEFSKGAFPGAVNLPLMNDIERQKVGTCYKLNGQDAAIDLGHKLVSGPIKAQRIEAWLDFANAHPSGCLYCFRGGLRSRLVQSWMAEAGVQYPRVEGGYKAMRGFLLNEVEQAVSRCEFVLIGGLTGSGKTEVLQRLQRALDLEGLANHRGSSFGKRATAQPAQIHFENSLAIEMMRCQANGQHRFVLEDESRLVGSCALPLSLYQRMQTSPVVWLEDTFENRVTRIQHDYVVSLSNEFMAVEGEQAGFQLFAQRLRQSLANIVKRLGHERYQRLDTLMRQALEMQQRSGDVSLHRAWIEGLLHEYYDPMYVSQREKKAARITFSGPQDAVVDYLHRTGFG
jgi:tRNA 2-selenouridine synthase